MTEGYPYQRMLGPSELRLLKPISISLDCISFTIVRVPRDSVPQYTAVSYVWGNEEPTETIHLDGRAYKVRPNLWSCLYYLGRFSQRTYRCLWVDAICINQHDEQERNKQVLHMDDTYRKAFSVSVWLGLIPVPDELRSSTSHRKHLLTADTDDLDWRGAMSDLANRPYWSRYWVIQEFLVGRDVTIHCGDQFILWEDFKDMLCHVAGIPATSNVSDVNLHKGIATGFVALPLLLDRHPDRHPESSQSLSVLLKNYRRASCKDPRDRIFALLGLIEGDERGLLERFFPNYALEVRTVQTIALAHVIQYPTLHICSLREFELEAQDIFSGLGVESRVERRDILDEAKRMDYIDSNFKLSDTDPNDLSSILRTDAQMQAAQGRIKQLQKVADILKSVLPGYGTLRGTGSLRMDCALPQREFDWGIRDVESGRRRSPRSCSGWCKKLMVLLILVAAVSLICYKKLRLH